MEAHDWDERYGQHEQVWSGRPNGALLVEVSGLPVGTALDMGCGEGADAVWLAEQGWQVTGLDVSQVALDRAASASTQRQLKITWVRAGVEDATSGHYDLVSLHYPALLRTPDATAERSLLKAVAPGGTLLVVGHARIDREHALAHGFDPDDYVSVSDIAALLDAGWDIEVDEERPRVDPPPGAEHVFD